MKPLRCFLATVMAALTSMAIASNEATQFTYPVSSVTSISQNFNTTPVPGASVNDPEGGWCAVRGTLALVTPLVSSKTECESNSSHVWVYGHTGVDIGGVCGLTNRYRNVEKFKKRANEISLFSRKSIKTFLKKADASVGNVKNLYSKKQRKVPNDTIFKK